MVALQDSGLVAGTQVRQSKSLELNPRSGHIAYFDSVITTLNIRDCLGSDIPRDPDATWSSRACL